MILFQGYPRPRAVATLFAAWLILALCLLKGVKSSGKVVYFTSLFPYVVLIILAIKGFSLPGAIKGIEAYVTPKWETLLTFQVWKDAAIQIIFSLGPACGSVITLSSYNKFDRNCQRDAFLVATLNSATSLFSGMVVFAILGFMAHESNKTLSEVVQSGPGIAFIVYPEVVSRMTGANILAALFFLMLITVALGSVFGAFEAFMTAVCDENNALRPCKHYMVLTASSILFILGLSFTCGGGIHMFILFERSALSWNLVVLGLLEVIIASWVYGSDKIISNLDEMKISHNWATRTYWKISWKFTTPLILTVLLIYSITNLGRVGMSEDYIYPTPIQALGGLITASTLIPIPAMALPEIFKSWRSGNYSSLLRETANWKRQSYGSVNQ